ncbi:MAG: DHA2 family efflux MFS transporter permease subunit [Pseudomonadota bacterium]
MSKPDDPAGATGARDAADVMAASQTERTRGEHGPHAAQGTQGPLARWLGFAALCVGMFMAILDIQIVVTSLPAIAKALALAPDQMSWVQTSYLIAEVIAIALTGVLTRAFGIRGLFLIALSTFTLASIACAMATGLGSLIAARVVQGFFGGCLIPLVFSSAFLLFSGRQQAMAATLAGGLAVLAPTLGPTIGGYITQTYSWPWLFLINVGPGIAALLVATFVMARERIALSVLARVDRVALAALVIGLGLLEVTLKEAPQRGWLSPLTLGLAVIVIASLSLLVYRCWPWPQGQRSADRVRPERAPLIDLGLLRSRNFAVSAAISFVFGIGLFSSIYLMAIFLGLVREFGPLAIGLVIIVTGVTQLIVSPLVVQADLRVDPRWLTGVGLAVLAIGLAMSMQQTRSTGYDEMFWPQVVRGVGIMLCLIPPTRLALDHLPAALVPDGSALFNLMRNLGGAIGIAVVDTILWQRTPVFSARLLEGLKARDAATAETVGIPISMLPPLGVEPTPGQIAMARPMIERAGLVEAINEAWTLLAVLTALAVVLVLVARPHRRA